MQFIFVYSLKKYIKKKLKKYKVGKRYWIIISKAKY